MNMTQWTSFLGYCLILNYAILIIWFLAFVFIKNFIKKLHLQWFKLSDTQFDVIHYSAMAVYKILILVFNLVPYIALKLL